MTQRVETFSASFASLHFFPAQRFEYPDGAGTNVLPVLVLSGDEAAAIEGTVDEIEQLLEDGLKQVRKYKSRSGAARARRVRH